MLEYITVVRETQGTNAKLEQLRLFCNDDTFRKTLFYTYNPYFQYYARKIPQYSENTGTASFEEVFALLDILRSRTVTGNAASDRIADLLTRLSPDNADVLKLMLGRDLKMGANATSVNKVIPNLIPTFEVMLAAAGVNIEDVLGIHHWVYVQKKSDGKRCIAVCQMVGDVITVDFFARSGKEMENLYSHTPLINNIIKLRKNMINHDFVLDGELIIENEDGSDANRQYSNGLIMKKDLSQSEVERFSYVVWDLIDLNEFQSGNKITTYNERYDTLLMNVSSMISDNSLKVIQTFTANSAEKVSEITKNFIDAGFEGSIVKTPYHYYQRKRTKDWIKFKEVNECDLVVIGYKYGKPGTKYETMLGSLICQSSDEMVNVDVGTGFSDELRQTITEEIIGAIITVQYNQLINNVNGEYSLYLPRFIEIRTDKLTADDLTKIKNNG